MGLLRLAPWRRGPQLLLRRPAVALALLAAALVASLPPATAPLFLSSAQHATLHRQIAETCQWQVGFQVDGPLAPAGASAVGADTVVGEERYRARRAAVANHPVTGLSGPLVTSYGAADIELVDRPMAFPDLRGLTLLARPGGREQVEVLAGPVGEGVWLPHEYAQLQGIEVGDELLLSFRGNEVRPWSATDLEDLSALEPGATSLPVAAIYRDLRSTANQPYWCGLVDLYQGSDDPHADPPLPVALVDTDTFMIAGSTLGMVAGQRIEYAVADPTLLAEDAATLAADIEALRQTLFRDYPALFPLGFMDNTVTVSHLDRYQQRAELVRAGLMPPVLPIAAAGALVGLVVTGAAAAFWVQRRRQELTVLAAHGVSSRGLGVKAVVEALPAVLAGTVAGWAAAWALVAAVGPSPVLTPAALPLSAAAALLTCVVAILLIGRLAASGTRGLVDARPVTRRRRWWARVPWELALVAAAPVAWLLLAADQVVDPTAGGVGTVAHVPARQLVAPILLIGGLAAFGARVTAAGLRRRGLKTTPASPARLLAWRRAVRAASTTAVLVAATAVPVAIATFGATATGSIRDTADAQLRFNLGSDTVLSYPRELDREQGAARPAVPESLTGQATEVIRLNQQRLAGLYVDVLAVDLTTFADGAFWDSRISGDSLDDAVEHLRSERGPTVVASRRITPGPQTLTVRGVQIPVEVAATRPLPGAQSYPLVLIDREVLRESLDDQVMELFTPEIWVADDPDRTAVAIADAQLRPQRMASIDDHRVGVIHEPITYTFQYLIALSVFTGLIGVVGLVLYLEARINAHRRAYVILRRMGLTAGSHRRALMLELGAPMAVGMVTGIAGAVAIAYGLRSGFDLAPARFPPALIALPATMMVVVAAAAVAVAIGAGLFTHARARRANPGEVLRETG